MDEQVELLRAIHSAMNALNGRVDTTNAALHGEIGGLRAESKEGLGGLRAELKEEIGGLRAEFKSELGGLRREVNDQLGSLRSESREELLLLRADLKGEARSNVERDLRLGAALAELSLDVRELTGIVHAWRHEHRLDREDLRERVARLERRVGLEPR